ncbi:ras GTPase-activating-like protein IQGAP1 [Acipenser ruthenus]|uniref:ras GTPase-activating-like protein IQGAP1 n=1 Tax=Acipenser ruthenus TaxID=7906 RepID=UPI0027428BBA|nr:ras GTPase-activating-like protein IQGAP1 [Acipenser ruthenus]XP_058851279.1 ras GTPase-activating-like protein IQGAP1 [Acipenser ruthenus]
MSASDETDALRPRYGSVLDSVERLTAEEMDERRQQNMAYEYLCHLEEAKRWMEACLDEELPPTTELEEGLRNGVYLAKLGNFFSPRVVSLKKIYDREQTRYKATGLHFRHTDNVIQWLNAMNDIGLPKIFYPETTDIYDRKNMPRSIYCIHALSLYLFKLGLAPQIQDLYGKVDFTEEEINNMKSELEKYGIQMPAFSKIGGILANELSVDEAALHAAVIAINDAIDHGEPGGTMAAMRNPNAMLVNLDEGSSQRYQHTLQQAKQDKVANARKRITGENSQEERDVYEELLTQAEIQGNVNKVNLLNSLEMVDRALRGGDEAALYDALRSQALGLRRLQPDNKDWYLKQLSTDHEAKEQNFPGELLQKEELQNGVDLATDNADRYQKMLRAVDRINTAIRGGVAEETVSELMNPEAQLPQVYPSASDLYQRELSTLQQQSPEGSLTHPELLVAVEMLSSVALINRALDTGDGQAVWKQLESSVTGLSNVEDENAQRYIDDLTRLKAAARAEGNPFLTWNDIQACVDQVNGTVQEEHERIIAIGLINEALDHGNAQTTLAALQHPAAKLSEVRPPVAQHYHDTLVRARREKAQDTQDDSAVLWLDEIQDGVCSSNKETEDSQQFSLGILGINEAVERGDTAQTLAALRSPDVGLYGVTPECDQAYQADLAVLKKSKQDEGDNGSDWVKHWVKGGYDYYFNIRTREGSWEEPANFIENNTQLGREDIQATISGVTSAYNREQLWLANENLITELQARCRGYLVRNGQTERLNYLKRQGPAITSIQSHWRGYKQRKNYLERKQYLKDHTEEVTKIQSKVRMHQARKRYQDRLKYFRDHIDDIVKIQAFIRANKARDDYKTLINAADPPMAVVRKFVHLLDQSDQDFQEELELMRLREEVVTQIRSNQQLENDLNLMDIKIGLLVKNKITLQEVVSHSKKLTKKNKGQLSDMMMMNKQGGLKALSKAKREKLEAYQFLFYLLQTNPTYLAKLIFQMPQNKSTKFMDSVIFTLYNYASNQREEYLLLKLFKTALQEEIKSKVDQIQEIVTGNPTVIKMVVSFNRGARGQNALRQILAPVVKETMDDKALSIKTDPVDIYKSWVNQMESQTGEASKLPYDVTPEQALSHEEVRTRLDASIKHMRTVTDKFLSAITVSVDKIPYGMRFIAKVLKDTLHEKFPDATEDELLKIIGNLLYYRYMNPAIVAPDAFDIIDMSAGGQLTTDQRRNLGSIAKMLQHAASNKMFIGDNSHLANINEYLSNSYQKFRRFLLAACDVPPLEDKFNVDEYSDLVTLTKPVIYITIAEIINTHTLLLNHQDAIASDHNDPIHELLEDLGEVPTIESMVGEGTLSPGDPNWDMLTKTEVSLTLTNKFDVPGSENEEMDARTLMLNSKRLIVDVIRFQPGETLTEILETPASSEQEAEYQRAMQRRAIRDAKTPEKMKQKKTAKDDSLTLQGKKDKIHANLQRLGEMGKVNPENRYQDLINDIAKDIRNQRRYRQRRKAELVKLQQTNGALNSKSSFYAVQIDYYNQYIKTCMDNLASKGKVSKKPGQVKKSKQVSQKYTAARLHEKGVLMEIEDLQTNQFKNVIFEISPAEEVGDFEVKAKFMGVQIETLMLHYQDLLQLQYEGVAVMKLFDRATVNVNLLIFLLNKKFYGK